MKTLTIQDVKHVADLARLSLTLEETTKFQKQLSEVVNYIGKLQEVNTQGIEPTSQTTGLNNVFRIDELKTIGSLSSNESLSGTDKTHNGYFVVDQVITKDE